MAFKDKIITNVKTGQQIRFIQTSKDTNGELLEMESTYLSGSKEPPPHYHPAQTEEFEVMSGEMSVRMDGKVLILQKGDRLHVPMNKEHSMWNHSRYKSVVNWKVRPALNTEYFFETAMGLSGGTKTNSDGMPNILQIALMVNRFRDVFRLAKPPYIVQRILFGILTPFALLSGYRAIYKKYLD